MKEFMVDFSYTFLPKLLNMTLTASVAILAVLILRLCLKRAPKAASYALWAIVLFRLLCPVSVQSNASALSLLNAPSSERGTTTAVMEYIPETIVHTAYPSVHLPVPGLSEVINEQLPQGHEQLAADPLEGPMALATEIWLLGVIGMLLYSVISYIRLRWKLRESVPLRDNIRITDRIATPFVIGLIRPKIYLPAGLSGREQEYILLHEQCHIRRLDHLVKLFSFLALTVHWFNPLVWLAFVLAEQDMEMSCDEAVVRRLGEDIRADYSASLLALSTGHRWIAGTPLAFGEGNPAGRIRNLAKWKKPALWVAIAAVLVCGIAAVCLLTNPKTKEYRIRVTIPAHTENAIYYSDEEISPYSSHFTVLLPEKETVSEADLYLRHVTFPNTDVQPEKISVIPGTPAEVDANRYTWYKIGLSMENPGDEPMDVYVNVRNVEVRIAASAEEPASPTEVSAKLEPYDMMLTGAYEDFLLIPMMDVSGGIVRYRSIPDSDTEAVTPEHLLYSFTEQADPMSVDWKIYALEEYPDLSVVLAVAGEDYRSLYQYALPERQSEDVLESLKAQDYLVVEDGTVTAGMSRLEQFLKQTEQGTPASMKLAHWYTLDPSRCDKNYYEVHKADYPMLFLFDLTYDGEVYTLDWTEQTGEMQHVYRYLRTFETAAPTPLSHNEPKTVTRYVLTSNRELSWEDLVLQMASSTIGNVAAFYEVCSIPDKES